MIALAPNRLLSTLVHIRGVAAGAGGGFGIVRKYYRVGPAMDATVTPCAPWDGRMPFCQEETKMRWKTPKFVEVCAGMEINGYFPSEL